MAGMLARRAERGKRRGRSRLQETAKVPEDGAVRWLLIALVSASSVLTAPAAAQDVAQARQLFEHGLEAARAAHWVEARDAFQQSLDIAERPSTLLNLAGAQVQTGQLVAGAASYRRFLEVARTGRDAAHRAEAQRQLTLVEARIAHATIRVPRVRSGDEVRLDDHVLLQGALGAIMALDPGPHALVVLRDGSEVAHQPFELAEAETAEVEVAIVAARAAASASEPVAVTDARGDAEPPHTDDSALWIGLGVGAGALIVVAVVIGAVVGTQGSPSPYMGNAGMGIVHF
jgi:hypothetical protein